MTGHPPTGTDGSTRLPVSHAQRALWLLHRLDPTSPAYHTGAALLVHPPLDPACLRRALVRLAQRHDMLRSTFHEVAGGVERRVRGDAAPTLELRPAGGVEGGGDGEPLRELARRTLNLPFALERGAFRFVLFDCAPADGPAGPARRSLLLMAAHHIATDAWSNWVLIRDLFELYRQEAGGERAELPAVAETFQDFVRREDELLRSQRYGELADYWRGVCAGVPAGELPTDHRRAAGTAVAGVVANGAATVGATHRLRLTGEEVAALRAAAAGCQVTMFAFLLGCFQALVSAYARQRSFLIGAPTSARHGARTRDVVGNFVNTLLFRADVTRATTFADLATGAYRQVGDGVRAVGFPFSLLPTVVHPARRDGTATLCRITFNLIGTPSPDPLLRALLDPDGAQEPVRHNGLLIQPIPVPQSEGQLDLAVHVQQSRDSLAIELRYDTGLFELETIQRLSVHYRRLLAAAAAQPDRAVARTPLLDAGELADLMGGGPGD